MYKVLGWINIALLVAILSPYWVRRLNGWFFHRSGDGYKRLMKTLRLFHKPLAVALLVLGAVHGWLALGALRLHTGSVLYAALLVTALFGLLFYLMKKKGLLTTHKTAALISVLLVAVHYFFPNILYRMLP